MLLDYQGLGKPLMLQSSALYFLPEKSGVQGRINMSLSLPKNIIDLVLQAPVFLWAKISKIKHP